MAVLHRRALLVSAELIAALPYLSQDDDGRPYLDQAKVRRAEQLDGKFVLTTNDDTLSVADVALGYKGMWIIEIGQSQMTKTDLLARPVCRHHVADLDVTIGDDHAVDQELAQGPPLLEGGLVQALPPPPAELPDGVGQAGEF